MSLKFFFFFNNHLRLKHYEELLSIKWGNRNIALGTETASAGSAHRYSLLHVYTQVIHKCVIIILCGTKSEKNLDRMPCNVNGDEVRRARVAGTPQASEI